MTSDLSRRHFLGLTTGTAAALALTSCANSMPWAAVAPRFKAKGSKLNIAVVGVGGRGYSLVHDAKGENLVALCDVDERSAKKAFEEFPNAKHYRDWRLMLEELDASIDAVVIGTPDHMHAPIAKAAMQRGMHVYVEKPLTWSIGEARELIEQLDDFFRNDPEVYVSGNLMFYYVEGNPAKCTSPDVFVVRGVPKGERRTYKLWEEGHPPQVVIELSSQSTWGDDLQRKWRLFERLGIEEYFIFDPQYNYLWEPLLAYRLVNGEYEEVAVENGRVRSEVLSLELVDTGETLRLFDPQAGEFLPTRQELKDRKEQAEAELARLREEIAKLRQSG